MGWSAKRLLYTGQMDFTCMISSEMFREFCGQDFVKGSRYVDCTFYHLDSPGVIRHVPQICAIENLDSIQWIPGAGTPPSSQWIGLLRQI